MENRIDKYVESYKEFARMTREEYEEQLREQIKNTVPQMGATKIGDAEIIMEGIETTHGLSKEEFDKEMERLHLIYENQTKYIPLVGDGKKDDFSLSDYTVSKPWGEEKWLSVTPEYAVKLIKMNAGFKSSLQSHVYKIEDNYVLSGEAEVLIEIDGVMTSRIIGAGQGWHVPAGVKHRVIAKTDYVALETSNIFLDDVIRYEDDSNRDSGVIPDEHK